MKIQCDVCEKGVSSVYCVADEAALCESCDHRVHHANKLASKHHRFTLLQPPAKQAPVCDICQERRAFLFCQQDRAILCRECDIPIHKSNEHTKKHNRFILTGAKLSESSALYSSSSASSSHSGPAAISANSPTSAVSDAVPNFNSHSRTNTKNAVSFNRPAVSKSTAKATTTSAVVVDTVTGGGGAAAAFPATATDDETSINETTLSPPSSSISEYLIEMLPGWHVEDFLDSSAPFGFCKSNSDSDGRPFWDDGVDSNLSLLSPESTGRWVPRAAPPNPHTTTQNQWFSTSTPSNIVFVGQIGGSKGTSNVNPGSRKWNDDNIFAVPHFNPPSSKSLKSLW